MHRNLTLLSGNGIVANFDPDQRTQRPPASKLPTTPTLQTRSETVRASAQCVT
jgi:hypothetical protein